MPIKAKEDQSANDSEKIVMTGAVEEKKSEISEEQTVVVKDQEPSVSLSTVKEMMEEMQKNFQAELAKVKAEKRNTSSTNADSDNQYIADLQDDYLEVPVAFFAFNHRFIIGGDFNKGREVKPPIDIIRFKEVYRSKQASKNGKGEQVVTMSSYLCTSKAELTFLKNHSLFGISFYETTKKTLSVDAFFAQKLIEASTAISRLTDAQMIARCKQEGIEISSDLGAMRKELIHRNARRSDDLEKNRQQQVIDKLQSYSDSDGQARQVITSPNINSIQ